jgi:hypothetical protein
VDDGLEQTGDLADLFLVQGFLLEQGPRERLELVAVLGQQPVGLAMKHSWTMRRTSASITSEVASL